MLKHVSFFLVLALNSALSHALPISGKVSLSSNPVCSLVLANGKHMFTCDGTGDYELDVPLDDNGQVTLFAFASGMTPYQATFDPSQNSYHPVIMAYASGGAELEITKEIFFSSESRTRIKGSLESYGSPVCGLVLANGVHSFTCGDELGVFDLDVPLDDNGEITLFGFVAGHQPYSDTFSGCGTNGACKVDNNNQGSDFLVGKFTDSEVTGLQYESQNIKGVTNKGVFYYKPGDQITFKVGGLMIGKTASKDFITPLDFEYGNNAARLLQSLDYDGNPDNGIVIDESVYKSELLTSKGSLDRISISDIDVPEFTSFYAELASSTSVGSQEIISNEDALSHLYKYTSYASIDRYVTNGTVHGSDWAENYGYNEPYDPFYTNSYPNLPEVHAGIDLLIPNGTRLYSLTSGVVSRVKESIGGVFIKPDNQEGTLVYLHLSDIAVSRNDIIQQGQYIGLSGNRGTGGYHLHIEWLRDDHYDPKENVPTLPKEIAVSTQGDATTATDTTFDLSNLKFDVVDKFQEIPQGIWVAEEKEIPRNDVSAFTPSYIDGAFVRKELTLDGNNRGRYSEYFSLDGSCGKQVANNSADVSYEIVDGVLKVVFLQEFIKDFSSDCGGFLLNTGRYAANEVMDFKVSSNLAGMVTLSADQCFYTYYGRCVLDSTFPFIQVNRY